MHTPTTFWICLRYKHSFCKHSKSIFVPKGSNKVLIFKSESFKLLANKHQKKPEIGIIHWSAFIIHDILMKIQYLCQSSPSTASVLNDLFALLGWSKIHDAFFTNKFINAFFVWKNIKDSEKAPLCLMKLNKSQANAMTFMIIDYSNPLTHQPKIAAFWIFHQHKNVNREAWSHAWWHTVFALAIKFFTCH